MKPKKPVKFEPIVAGTDASQHEFPWMAVLYNEGRLDCGGTLISPQFVLTAAHCFISGYPSHIQPTKLTVRLGAHKLDEHDKYDKIVHVERIIINPEFIGTQKHTRDWNWFIHDNALLKLKEYVSFKHGAIEPICITSYDGYYVGELATIAGWGHQFSGDVVSNTLKKAEVRVSSTLKCTKFYGDGLTDDMICAGDTPRDTCRGDSGGPLLYQEDTTGRWIQIGITSYGRQKCGQYPGVYSSVAYANPWIKQIVGEANLCVVHPTHQPKPAQRNEWEQVDLAKPNLHTATNSEWSDWSEWGPVSTEDSENEAEWITTEAEEMELKPETELHEDPIKFP